MAALSPLKCLLGKNTFSLSSLDLDSEFKVVCRVDDSAILMASFLNRLLAETPPAMTIDWVSEYCWRAKESFSRRMSMAVCSKEAEKLAICSGERSEARLWEGKEMGFFSSFWTERRTAVFRPEKEKSRLSTFGWGNVYLCRLPGIVSVMAPSWRGMWPRAAWLMEGPPG